MCLNVVKIDPDKLFIQTIAKHKESLQLASKYITCNFRLYAFVLLVSLQFSIHRKLHYFEQNKQSFFNTIHELSSMQSICNKTCQKYTQKYTISHSFMSYFIVVVYFDDAPDPYSDLNRI